MTRNRFQQIERLVSVALERAADERMQLIQEACGNDSDLRCEVESLLACHEKQDGFATEAPFQLRTELLHGEEPSGKLCHPEGGIGASPGRFKLLGELGTGGMGVVFAAHDLQLGRKIAIKLIRPQTFETLPATDRHSWLMREARAMAQISHPNVVAVHDVGTLGDQLFIAMEYVEGTTLKEWLSEKKRSWHDVLRIFIQAGRGLAAAHAGGILHRDFKPENVLVDKHGRVRLVDFGLAGLVDPDPRGEAQAVNDGSGGDANDFTVTDRTRFAGTPAYMAPEQLIGQPADEKTDQYSFCVALFQGLYGELPFNPVSLGALLEQIQHGQLNQIPKLSSVPSWLHQTVLRGLRPNPADRFSSMRVLLDVLERQRAVSKRRRFVDATVVMVMSILHTLFSKRPRGRVMGENSFGLTDTLAHLQ